MLGAWLGERDQARTRRDSETGVFEVDTIRRGGCFFPSADVCHDRDKHDQRAVVGVPDPRLQRFRTHADWDLYVGNESAHRQNSALKRLLLLTLIDKCEQLATLTRLGYFRMLDLVERNSKDSLYMSRQRLFASDEVKHAIARKYSLLVRFFGERTVITELRSLMKVLDLVDVLWMAFDHRIPFSTLLRAAKIEMRRGRGRRHSMAHSGRAGLQSTSAADFRPNPEGGQR